MPRSLEPASPDCGLRKKGGKTEGRCLYVCSCHWNKNHSMWIWVNKESLKITHIWGSMVDRLHILTWNRTKKPLAIVLSGEGRKSGGRGGGGDLTNAKRSLYGIVTWISPVQWTYPDLKKWGKNNSHVTL
jgi:hypothetical protein